MNQTLKSLIAAGVFSQLCSETFSLKKYDPTDATVVTFDIEKLFVLLATL